MLDILTSQQQSQAAQRQANHQTALHPTNQANPTAVGQQQAQQAWTTFFAAQQANADRVRDGHRQVQLSVENQRANSPWGDILEEKSESTTRVYSLNANGFTLDRRGGQFDEFCKVTKEVQADIVACQEHCLDTTQPVVRSVLFDTLRNSWTRSRLTLGTTPITYSNMYKPGGTLIVSTSHVTGRVISTYSDKWGRWTSQTFRCQQERKLTVISAYQVVPDTPSPGKTTAAEQQRSLLLESQDPLREPRPAFVRDFQQYLQMCLSTNDDLLIMGDFNDTVGRDCNPLTTMMSELGLLNLMSVRHDVPPPPTYARGKKCLDYGFGTPRVTLALTACGYEAFNARYTTDHRSYFFDFDTTALFGTTTPTLANPQQRILHSTNVKQLTSYIKLVYDYLVQCNAFERASRLSHPGDRHAFAERLDRDMIQACLMGEKKLKRFGDPVWSVALDQARKKATILRKCLSMIRTGLNLTEIISESNKQLKDPLAIPRTKQECCTQLRTVKREVEDIVATSIQRRDEEIKQRITALENTHGKKEAEAAIILRRLLRAEAIKRLFAKLRSFRLKGVRHGVTSIEIPMHPDQDPKTCTEWRTIDVPSEIVEHIQERNKAHFGQAHGTPFTVPPLATDLGFCGHKSGATDILTGRYDSTPFEEHVQLLIQHLKITQEMTQEQSYPTITDGEFVGKLKVWKESTATSPSGLHLGHYKALIARHEYSNDDEEFDTDPDHISKKEEWDHMQRSLRQFHLDLINYALERGYSYQRWQTIANTILFKDADNVKLHRTRVIHIYEADFNLVLGLKWRMAMYQAEALKTLNNSQYGSRPNRNAIDPVMLEEIQFEISRVSRRMLIQTNYDATSCYDRIIPNLAMVVSKKFGVHPNATLTSAKTLQLAKYHVRTELGLSLTSFSHSSTSPIYGTGQGSGFSPMNWLFLSSLLLDIYEAKATPATYCNPDGTNATQLAMVALVDDKNGQANRFKAQQDIETLQWLIGQAQENAATWAKLLGASGGALELKKCSYHVMYWKFSMQGAPVLTNMNKEIPQLTVQDPYTNQPCDLEYLNPYQAHKTLGHFKEPAGIQTAQFNQLKEKSDSITDFLWACPLTRAEAWTYYTACYLPSVCYPLTSSHLTAQQLTKIQQKAMTILIPRCGFNRNMHRSIVYGPQQLGGATFRHLAVEQGVLQVSYFLRHWRLQSQVGILLKCALSWIQVSVGVSYSVLENAKSVLPHMESKWIASMRVFLAKHDLSLLLDDPCVPTLQRQNDAFIMDLILGSNHYSPAEIRKLNYCRLFLNVITLSDLAHPCGQLLDQTFLSDQLPPRARSRSSHLSVHQDSPSPPEWKLWRRANLIWSTLDGRLRTPLGEWLYPLHEQRRHHFAYHSDNVLWLFQEESQEYREYQRSDQSALYQATFFHTSLEAISAHAIPATVKSEGLQDQWSLHTLGQPSIPIVQPPACDTLTFAEFVQTLADWEVELLQHVEMEDDPFEFCIELQPNQRAVSDGSVRHDNQGAFGWTIRNEHGTRVASGMGPARGSKPTSYRAEAYGLLSILLFLVRIAEYTDMQIPWIGTIGTDSQSVLDTLNGKDEDPQQVDQPMRLDGGKVILDVLIPDWDVLVEIQQTLLKLPRIKLEYVKGHQDRTTSYAQLDQMAQLNVDADAKAAQYQDTFGAFRPIVKMMTHTKAHLNGPQGTITGHYQTLMRYHATAAPLKEYMQAKYQWSQHVFDAIHWEAHGAAFRKVNKNRIHYTKLVFDQLPTTSQANKFDKGNRTCPSCAHSTENRDHILRCTSPKAIIWREEFRVALSDFCRRTLTAPILKTLLTSALDQWFSSLEDIWIDPREHPESLGNLIIEQNAIGWRQIFSGRFSREWSIVQQAQYHRLPPPQEGQRKRTGDQWQTQLIVTIWKEWDTRWTERNKALHGYDAATRQHAIRRDVQRQIDRIYQQRHLMEPSVQALLHPDPDDHQEQQLGTTRNWLAQNTALFTASIRRVKRNAIQGVRSIRTYFQPRLGD